MDLYSVTLSQYFVEPPVESDFGEQNLPTLATKSLKLSQTEWLNLSYLA